MVGLGRLELPTSRLSSVRSNQLSYKPHTFILKQNILLIKGIKKLGSNIKHFLEKIIIPTEWTPTFNVYILFGIGPKFSCTPKSQLLKSCIILPPKRRRRIMQLSVFNRVTYLLFRNGLWPSSRRSPSRVFISSFTSQGL